jgi:hypothetical protein
VDVHQIGGKPCGALHLHFLPKFIPFEQFREFTVSQFPKFIGLEL